MLNLNDNFTRLPDDYLFAEVARRVQKCRAEHPEMKVISLGIGDVTRPLCPAVIEAAHKAVDDLSREETFRGYGPEQGHLFLRKAIADNDYLPRGVELDPDEIFVSDGAKSDLGNFQELFSASTTVAVMDPVYPVYVDSNVMAGRAGAIEDGKWRALHYLPCTPDNGFMPEIPADGGPGLIYLCYPNNPTGAVMTAEKLAAWVDYALRNDALILYDSAYHAYIRDARIPHSIYEIEGARKCAVEFRSYSKTAGFTGLRCGYTVVPKDIRIGGTGLNHLWFRRQCTKFNGASYVSQRAAEAVHSPEGRAQNERIVDYYMTNASKMLSLLSKTGLEVSGGENAPYIWVRTPDGAGSWDFFGRLLYGAGVVCTPGAGFGPHGEGFIRLTAFGSHEDCDEALARIGKLLRQ